MLQPLAIRREPETGLDRTALADAIHRMNELLERRAPPRFPVRAGEGWVFLDLRRVTHFEVAHEVVHAHAGERFRTSWTTLMEAEAAFPHEDFLRIQRHLLIRPEAVVGFKMTWGGRGEVRLSGGVDLEVSRGAVPRLKERLGLR